MGASHIVVEKGVHSGGGGKGRVDSGSVAYKCLKGVYY